MVAWPGSLPQTPLTQGYSEQPQDQTLRTQMDAGPPKVRRRFTAAVETYRVVFDMTETQVSTFETFFDSTINGGADPFDFTHPRKGTTVEARFVGAYQIAHVSGTNYRLSAVFEVLP